MRDTIHFLLGDRPRALSGVGPTTTVLEYLRGNERLRGTKEGCAEGDCGACTVVLGTPRGDGVLYQAVNACILFVHALDGRQLLTVEHLAGEDGTPHPVQAAMVEHHASQCGFCTPGFVMSLFALHQTGEATRPAVLDALAGNLCRCTGYRPIIDAALACCGGAPADRFGRAARETSARLRELPQDALALEHGGQALFVPDSLPALAALLRDHPHATLLAGGTDVGLWVTKQHRRLTPVIALERVAELARIAATPDALRIGAMASYTDALDALAERWADFGTVLRRLGSVQVRNRGTLGGNIANGSPIGDTMPLLIALGATLVLRRGETERTLPVEEFFRGYRRTALQPGELLTRIDIPAPQTGQRFAAYKIAKRFDQDISAVCAAFCLTLDGDTVCAIRIGFGGMAATPARAVRTEQALAGRQWTPATIQHAIGVLDAEFTPMSDQRASAQYRAGVARNLLRKFFVEATSDAPARLVAA